MTEALSDEALLAELGVDVKVEAPRTYTALEARLIAGFEDIQRFYEEHDRAPKHGEDNDIFERLYAVRLDRLRENAQALQLLTDIDKDGLLAGGDIDRSASADLDDEALLASLGASEAPVDTDITKLRNVSPVAHRRAAEEIAGREVCRDFELFEPIFKVVKGELKTGIRETRTAATQEDFDVGRLFILNGQMAYIAWKGEEKKATGKNLFDARLRVIFDNGTESGLLMRSLQRALNGDERGRSITEPNAGPLFADQKENETGTIYVLRSKSNLPQILPIRDAILKVGVTKNSVKTRIANASKEATYLLGEVEIVDEYTLYNVNRNKLEKMLQHIFQDAQMQVEIPDRFGNLVKPREWFFVTPQAVAKAVELIRSQKIQDFTYNRDTASFEKTGGDN
ncbi:GIY-YIG nuclease family protein [Hellea balneolensis]|uniref:GIY-YIG nuclease family protein n=1 Tax=Hellea balneolensis TaxID=287478 RepID=UPI00040933DC|nr:GIY-YIG nuclease family protein [Hellea balneolensis]